jgi:hypothetical protein
MTAQVPQHFCQRLQKDLSARFDDLFERIGKHNSVCFFDNEVLFDPLAVERFEVVRQVRAKTFDFDEVKLGHEMEELIIDWAFPDVFWLKESCLRI